MTCPEQAQCPPEEREKMGLGGLKISEHTRGTVAWLQHEFKMTPMGKFEAPDIFQNVVRAAGSGLGWS